MFKDYYAILEIDESANQEEIKTAFKQQALKWHPDRNPGQDTTFKMQEINEAYLILKDTEARERYNTEYQFFKQFQKNTESHFSSQKAHQADDSPYHRKKQYEYQYYPIQDDVLEKWMNNARKQAVDLAKQTIDDFKGMVSVGVKEAAKGAGMMLVAQLGVGLFFMTMFTILKGCN
jgi:DnaJ-class molecular chaperone